MSVKGNGQATHQYVVEFISKNLKQWSAEVKLKSD
jgi:hypothetical protein